MSEPRDTDALHIAAIRDAVGHLNGVMRAATDAGLTMLIRVDRSGSLGSPAERGVIGVAVLRKETQ